MVVESERIALFRLYHFLFEGFPDCPCLPEAILHAVLGSWDRSAYKLLLPRAIATNKSNNKAQQLVQALALVSLRLPQVSREPAKISSSNAQG